MGPERPLMTRSVYTPYQACCRLAVPAKYWDVKTDIVVIGAGIAGLMASIEAHDRGASVLLLEMAESPFCCESAVCGGGMAIPGTDIQSAKGITDSSASLYNDILQTGRGSNRAELVKLFTDHVNDAYARLRQLGGICRNLGYIGGHSVAREHQHDPIQVQTALFGNLQTREIATLFNTRVQSLVVRPGDGRVLGLIAAQTATGEQISVEARATVLATGGMCGSPEMLGRYVPRMEALALRAAVGVDGDERPIGLGDGYRMAMAIGADTTHMYSVSTYTGIPHPEHDMYSNRSRRPWFPSYQEGAIAVNREGRRFIEETRSPPCAIGEEMIKQPGSMLFKICDNRFWQSIVQGEAEAELIRNGKGYLWQAESVEQLAATAGIDPLGLSDTIDRYNRFAKAGLDDDLGRPSEYLVPIESPPFVAHQNCLIVLHNSGGLRANEKLQIMHVCGKPIPGLYGAGEVVGGTSGEVYLTATHYPTAMTFGYLVGREFALAEL